MGMILDLQKERGAQFSRRRDQPIVDLDFLPNLIQVGDFFRPHYLLDLKDNRVPVLEDQSHLVSHRNTSAPFNLDNALARLLPLFFIGGVAYDVLQYDLVHKLHPRQGTGTAMPGLPQINQLAASAGSLPAIFSKPLENRPACDFSALAKVSNHSANSEYPSSRAVLANPGYISVYS